MPFALNKHRAFIRDRRGNFAMMLSIATVPVLFAVGLAIDFTGVTSTRSELQNANDAAVLFAAKHRQTTGNLPGESELNAFLATNFPGVVLSSTPHIEGENIVLDTRAKAQLYVFSSFSDYAPEVAVRSAAPVADDNVLEVALALDTTYSMIANDKIGGLKTAATDFVNKVMDSAGPNNVVRIGVVPFSNYVNVGMHNRNEPWMSVPADSVQAVDAYCANVPEVLGTENCRNETRYADGVPYNEWVCDNIYGPPKEVCYPATTKDVKWWGCVGDRASPRTLTDEAPNDPFPGMMDSWNMLEWACPTPIQTLSTNKAEVLAAVDGLTPRGETYIVDGVTWATKVLSPQAPFTEGADPTKTTAKVKKVMVLMSDGDNTMSSQLPDYHGHWNTDANQSNVWTKTACANARADGVEIYAITFGTEVSNNGKDVMEKCASDEAHYFDAANSAALAKAFDDIAGKLLRIRLTM